MAHILIVDDEVDTLQLLNQLMIQEGHSTRCASNGWEALMATGDSRFDLILLDMTMPGLDGGKFLQIFRKAITAGDTPVVVVTALDREVAEERIRPSRVEGLVIKKPSEMIANLLTTVRKVVGPSGAARGGGAMN